MPSFNGFVEALQVRDDGWVEATLLAPEAGNARDTFFLADLDGNVAESNRRLARLGLLRDALARSHPVEIEFRADGALGNEITDVVVHARASLEGFRASRQLTGVVVGLAVQEVGASSAGGAYRDLPAPPTSATSGCT